MPRNNEMRLSPKQKEFWNEPYHRWNIKYGATRSGKTYLDYFVILREIRKRTGLEGHIVFLGNTKGTLQRNVIEPMQDIYGANLVSSIRTDNTATIFGERVHCLGADSKKHIERIRGMSIKYCYGDEMVSWEQGVFEMLKSRLDKPYSRFDGTCNPQGPEHWVKKFLDSRELDIFSQHYTLDDNPFLDTTVRAEMKREHTGVFYDRNILGMWVRAEGLVYPMFDNVVPTEERAYDKYFISMDYGIQNATSMHVYGHCAGVWYSVREYYHSGRETGRQKTDEQYYEELVRLAGDLPIRAVIIDPSAASFITLVQQKHRFKVWDADNAVLEGIQNTAGVLAKKRLMINDCCVRQIAEFHAYCWDDNEKMDAPLKVNDHAMDDMRYFVQTAGVWKDKGRHVPGL